MFDKKSNKHRIYLAFYPREDPKGWKLGILLVPKTSWILRLAKSTPKRAILYQVYGTVFPSTVVWRYQTQKLKPTDLDLTGLVLLGKLPPHFTEADLYAYMFQVPIVQHDPTWSNMNWVFDSMKVFPPSQVHGSEARDYLKRLKCPPRRFLSRRASLTHSRRNPLSSLTEGLPASITSFWL
jgi:hypothetical protein